LCTSFFIESLGEEKKSSHKSSKLSVKEEEPTYDIVDDIRTASNVSYSSHYDYPHPLLSDGISNAEYHTIIENNMALESHPPQASTFNVNGYTEKEGTYHILEEPEEACYDGIIPSTNGVRFTSWNVSSHANSTNLDQT